MVLHIKAARLPTLWLVTPCIPRMHSLQQLHACPGSSLVVKSGRYQGTSPKPVGYVVVLPTRKPIFAQSMSAQSEDTSPPLQACRAAGECLHAFGGEQGTRGKGMAPHQSPPLLGRDVRGTMR